MTPERWRQIEDLYHRVLEKKATERLSFLRQAGGGDEELRREVESLLAQTGDESTSARTEVTTAAKPARPTWWMYLIGASYAITFGLIIYLVGWGPVEIRGISATFDGQAMVVQSLTPDSQAAKGGLRVADRVLTIDDVPMRAVRDWNFATGNLRPLVPHHWLVARGDQRLTLDISRSKRPVCGSASRKATFSTCSMR